MHDAAPVGCDDGTVGNDDERHPLRAGRGFVDVQRFAAGTGLDATTIASLIEAGRLDGLVDLQGHAVGLFEDPLPTADELRALGLSVSSRHRPEELRSHQDDSEDGELDPEEGAGSSWTMPW